MSFTKLHQSLITSTIWREPNHIRVAWITMLAMGDKNGEVMASIPGLADICRITIPEMQEALACFLSPDEFSRTKDYEGRRIEEIDGGWFLLNHPKYRKMASKEDAMEKAAVRQANFKERQAALSVTRGNAPSRMVTRKRTEAEEEADAKAEDRDAALSSFFLPPVAAHLAELIQSGEYVDPEGEFRRMQRGSGKLTLAHIKNILKKRPLEKKVVLPNSPSYEETF